MRKRRAISPPCAIAEKLALSIGRIGSLATTGRPNLALRAYVPGCNDLIGIHKELYAAIRSPVIHLCPVARRARLAAEPEGGAYDAQVCGQNHSVERYSGWITVLTRGGPQIAMISPMSPATPQQRRRILAGLSYCLAVAHSQTSIPLRPQFEVASIKRSVGCREEGGRGGGGGGVGLPVGLVSNARL
jgi:hypothetical protein